MSGLLQVHNLSVDFATAQGIVRAVRDVSFSIAAGEVLGLVGESGSGKSVSSLAILRLLPPQARVSGRIEFRGEDLLSLPEAAMREIRGAGISMIFQEPMTALNPVMRIGDQVAEAVLAHPGAATRSGDTNGHRNGTQPRISKSEAWREAVEALRTVAIPEPERRARDYPHQLSGGQRQRVMIAMAIVNRPQLLIADEPTTALDVTIQAQVLDLLNELRQKFALSMLFVSHDLAVVSQVSHRIAVMYAGSLVEVGTRGAGVPAGRCIPTREVCCVRSQRCAATATSRSAPSKARCRRLRPCLRDAHLNRVANGVYHLARKRYHRWSKLHPGILRVVPW